VQVELQVTHVVALSDALVWLAEHGVDGNEVQRAAVHIDRDGGAHIRAWLDVTYYLLNEHGERYPDWSVDPPEATTAQATIPLRSWPPLLPIAEVPTDAR
jgi:hypothetical protein